MRTRRRRPLTRHERDLRLGYGGLGAGAGLFVLMLVASYIVVRVAPVLVPEVFGQATTVRIPVPPTSTGPGQPGTGGSSQPGTAQRVTATRSGRGPRASQAVDGSADQTGTAVFVVPPTGSGTPPPTDPPTGPPTGAQGRIGPVSALLDPVVNGLTGTLDNVTGGAIRPLTQPVGGLTDGLTDLLDGLLGHPDRVSAVHRR